MIRTLEEKLKTYRLSQDEYMKMKDYLGHEPQDIEWAVYSALWSEHCSYKSSKIHLRKFFTKHPRVVQGPGENAGVIDLGKGERVCFKMESHNHPSFIEPVQGSATGVGGILRDIFTMGARPIASMDCLWFGEPKNSRTKELVKGVVKGIGGYGNCVGVPTVGGSTTFDPTYNNNILVNAFCLGLFRPGEEIFYGKASGVGNWIVYAGAKTGRDGIHGAAMASESFDQDSEKKKPNVQIGDPFFEKLLIEACLDVMKQNLVVGIQDMGAAGLTSSTFEMASRAKTGLKIDLTKVPLREPDITAEEIMLSESQERMVLVVEPGNYSAVEAVFRKWDLDCCKIGEITDSSFVELFWGDKLLAKMDHEPLVEKAPVYERPFSAPEKSRKTKIVNRPSEKLEETLIKLLGSVQMSSKNWITKQYDSTVGARTISANEDGVALIKLRDSSRVLGIAPGCRTSLMKWSPFLGAMDAVIMPTLQLASRGIQALAVTDCLNFGNPENPKIMGEFVASVQGINEACRQFDVPIISGNVSLYNETLGQNITSTPATVLVGTSQDEKFLRGITNKEGASLFLVKTKEESTLLASFCELLENKEPEGEMRFQLYEVEQLQKFLLAVTPIAEASQVVGKGGLASALFKITEGSMGINVNYFESQRDVCEMLFAERFYSAVIAVESQNVVQFLDLCSKYKEFLNFENIGQTKMDVFAINHYCQVSMNSLRKIYENGFGRFIDGLS